MSILGITLGLIGCGGGNLGVNPADGSVSEDSEDFAACLTRVAGEDLSCEGDVDGDAVANADDRCPLDQGPSSNSGCPEDKPIPDPEPEPEPPPPFFIRRVSVSTDGMEGNISSEYPSISGNGRMVAFVSEASNLVEGDTNGVEDVFVHDLWTEETNAVSMNSSGDIGNACSRWRPALSANGRYVSFTTLADNLVTGGEEQALVKDLETGDMTIESLTPEGEPSAQRVYGFPWHQFPLSDDGRHITFVSETYDLATDTVGTDLVDQLVTGSANVFNRDRETGETRWVSAVPYPSMINFSWNAAISGDGRFSTFTSRLEGTARCDHVFIQDREDASWSEPLSVDTDGNLLVGDDDSSTSALSYDGRYIVFHSAYRFVSPGLEGGGLVLLDRLTGDREVVSINDEGEFANVIRDSSFHPSISADGRFVSFPSEATNLDPTYEMGGVFVRDRQEGITRLVSVSEEGIPATNSDYGTPISADGKFIAFASSASNLVPGDTNETLDVFVVSLENFFDY